MIYLCMHEVHAAGNRLLSEMLRGTLYQQARICGVGGTAHGKVWHFYRHNLGFCKNDR